MVLYTTINININKWFYIYNNKHIYVIRYNLLITYKAIACLFNLGTSIINWYI